MRLLPPGSRQAPRLDREPFATYAVRGWTARGEGAAARCATPTASTRAVASFWNTHPTRAQMQISHRALTSNHPTLTSPLTLETPQRVGLVSMTGAWVCFFARVEVVLAFLFSAVLEVFFAMILKCLGV